MERRWKLYQQQPDLCHQISQLRITALKLAMEDVGYSSQQAKTLSQKAFDFFLDARHQVTFYNTVEPLLENLKKEYSLGVLTNGNADIFRLEMGRFFDFSFSAEQLNASKPAADHFLAAQKVSGAIAAEVIHIGDHIEHDILAAQQAGCFSIWFNPEMKKPKDDIQATKQVQCLSEIPAAISAIKETLSAN
jgi:putative hydrolase of the HAD superfamily